MSRDLDLAAADLLDRAADYIETHGWTRGTFERDGRVCAAGALNRADTAGLGAYRRAREILGAKVVVTGGPTSIGAWNDAQKSRRPVLRTLREVAAEVRTRATDGAA